MTILLDTNVFLLFAVGSPRLSPRVRSLIESQTDELVVSAVTPWELAIKSATGALELPESVETVYRISLADMQATELPITAAHALRVATLPLLHRDPFDRLLIAQAIPEGLPLATNDRIVGRYGIDVIW